MKLHFKKSFTKSYRKLSDQEKRRVDLALIQFQGDHHYLSHSRKPMAGTVAPRGPAGSVIHSPFRWELSQIQPPNSRLHNLHQLFYPIVINPHRWLLPRMRWVLDQGWLRSMRQITR